MKDKCIDQYCLNGGTCEDGTCICPLGYGGEHCETCTTDGYRCISGNCIYVICDAAYYSLSSCLAVCGGGAEGGYNCVSGNCSYTSGTAQYATLSQCQSGCGSGGSAGYNCLSGNCQYVSSNAQFGTLAACQSGCGSGGSAGYNCVSGNCQNVSSNAQYATLATCQNGCSGGITAIHFVNNSHTDMQVTFKGMTKSAASNGGVVAYTGTAGTSASGSAWTSGKTSSGSQVGLRLDWDLNYTFPASGISTVNLNVSTDYFFLKMRNNGTTTLGPVYVNYGLQSETVDHIEIPRDNLIYSLGYYRAWANSNVRAYRPNGQAYVSWNSITLPWTTNQSLTLTNTL